jgi:hypothetical protein
MNCGCVSARSFAPFQLRTCIPIFTKLRMKVTSFRIYEGRASEFLEANSKNMDDERTF